MRGATYFSVLVGLSSLIACTGSRDPAPLYPRLHSNDAAFAAAVTGVAAVAYATGGGCRISDCPSDTVCNPATERCERVECSGPPDASVCPSGSQCQASTGTCVPF